MKRSIITILSIFSCFIVALSAPVDWSCKIINDNTDHPSVVVTAKINGDYHLFSQDNPPGGSNPLVFTLYDLDGVKPSGSFKADKPYIKEFDDIFEVDQHFWNAGTVTFTQKLIPTADKWSLTVNIDGQVCNDSGCIQQKEEFKVKGVSPVQSVKAEEAGDIGDQVVAEGVEDTATDLGNDSESNVSNSSAAEVASMGGPHWDNVVAEFNVFGAREDRHSWLWILIAGFIGGLIALVTPCVWPMIPMTVSFFLKQNKTRAEAIKKAIIYGASIIMIYVVLGLVVTLLFGATALNSLSTNAIFNIIFFLLLVVFAISFMGGFELTLPSSWTNKMDSKVDSTTGLLSIFFMAFTLALVSFSCTGPIIGTLLVEAASTIEGETEVQMSLADKIVNLVNPAIGMFGFALALAIPFTLFAIFPTMLKAMPKSGGWMNTVKVVLGFLELALALKFLSVADLAYGWRILDREVFLALWIVIFFLLGVYLLGKIRFPHDDDVEKTSVTRFLLACVSFAFAVYMIPGLWGAPLKSISAFSPPLYTQDFNLFEGEVSAQVDDYDQAIELSRTLNKPLMLDFSGYGCVNCRKMEAAVWTDPEIKRIIDEDYILVTLMVDDKTPLRQPITVTAPNGKEKTLRTVGDKWGYLEESKFESASQPYYVLVDAEGYPLAAPFAYKEDIPAYKAFLEKGLENFKKEKKDRK